MKALLSKPITWGSYLKVCGILCVIYGIGVMTWYKLGWQPIVRELRYDEERQNS